jgi:hypothetical protein
VPPGERTWWEAPAIKVPNIDLNESINYDVSAKRSRKLLHIQKMESGDKFPLKTVEFGRIADNLLRTTGKPSLIHSIDYDASASWPRGVLHIQKMESGDKFPFEATGFEHRVDQILYE